MPACPNLATLFSDRYQVCHEEDLTPETANRPHDKDPWRLVLLCRYGTIWPAGDDKLGESTTIRGKLAPKLMALSCVTLTQNADDGVSVTFHLDDFDQVAALMQPKKRRRLSSEQVAIKRELLSPYQFRASREAVPQLSRDMRTVAPIDQPDQGAA